MSLLRNALSPRRRGEGRPLTVEAAADGDGGASWRRDDRVLLIAPSWVGDGKRGPLTARLQGMFFDAVYGRNPARAEWLTLV